MQRDVSHTLFYSLFITLAFLAASVVHGDEPSETTTSGGVYKQINPDGTVTYTDKPPSADAKPIKVPKGTEYSPPKLPAFTPSPPKAKAKQFEYESFAFLAPKEDESIWDNTGNITTMVALEPGLQPGHSIEFLLDGQSVARGGATSHQFLNMDRGTHQVTAQIIDSKDRVIESVTVTFHMKRHAIGP